MVLALAVIAAAAFFAWTLTLPPKTGYSEERSKAEIKQNAENIRYALQRYHDNEGKYPLNLDTLLVEGYLDRMPRNPYARNVRPGDKYVERYMRQVEFSEADFAGNFHYRPAMREQIAWSYQLYVFGKPEDIEGGAAMDNVLLVLKPEVQSGH